MTEQEQALARLDDAYRDYRKAAAALAAIRQCSSWWVDGETRCDLVDHHPPPHRHKPKGLAVGVITW